MYLTCPCCDGAYHATKGMVMNRRILCAIFVCSILMVALVAASKSESEEL